MAKRAASDGQTVEQRGQATVQQIGVRNFIRMGSVEFPADGRQIVGQR
jgi:hypothetical protein